MPSRKRILIIDNDEDVLIALEQMLESEGFETVTAWDMQEGLQALSSGFDLLLAGDHPPEVNCERLLKQLQCERIAVPCVVLHSAARHPFSIEYLRFLGASGVACKWNYSEVAGEVRRCLRAVARPASPGSFAAAS